MDLIPNYQMIGELRENVNSEFDLDTRLKRYESMSPELIEFAEKHGLSKSDESAQRALFLADFIVTASELIGASDEERRSCVLELFKIGLETRNESSKKVMETMALGYYLGSKIRKNDLFLASRGLPMDIRYGRIHYNFIAPFLYYTREFLESSDFGFWELAVLFAAIRRTDLRLEYEDSPKSVKVNSVADLVEISRRKFISYTKENQIEEKKDAIIPNYLDTKAILSGKWKSVFSSFSNIDKQPSNSSLESLHSHLSKLDSNYKLQFLSGNLLDENNSHLILVRNPYVSSKPSMILTTKVDGVNATQMTSILELVDSDAEGWLKEFTIEVEQKENTYETQSSIKPPAPQKKGFIAKLLGMFKKEDSTPTGNTRATTKVQVSKLKRNMLPNSLADSLSVEAVSDIPLFETFDVIRESEYVLDGALESDYTSGQTSIYEITDNINPTKLISILDGLDVQLESVLSELSSSEVQFKPEEIVFSINDNEKVILTFSGDENRLVAVIGSTRTRVMDYPKKGDETVKRRTLMMRAGQLLSARNHTALDSSVMRILNLEKLPEEFKVEKSILNYAK